MGASAPRASCTHRTNTRPQAHVCLHGRLRGLGAAPARLPCDRPGHQHSTPLQLLPWAPASHSRLPAWRPKHHPTPRGPSAQVRLPDALCSAHHRVWLQLPQHRRHHLCGARAAAAPAGAGAAQHARRHHQPLHAAARQPQGALRPLTGVAWGGVGCGCDWLSAACWLWTRRPLVGTSLSMRSAVQRRRSLAASSCGWLWALVQAGSGCRRCATTCKNGGAPVRHVDGTPGSSTAIGAVSCCAVQCMCPLPACRRMRTHACTPAPASSPWLS